jgi:PLP dependent protein
VTGAGGSRRHSHASSDSADVEQFRAARDVVLDRIASSCDRVGRDPAGVRLVAVTKTVQPDRIRTALAAGQTVFGENRVQEAVVKAAVVRDARWHLIGPLQSNKARRAIEVAEMIESVDSVELARRLDRLVRELGGLPSEGPVAADARRAVLLQVNVDADPTKHGFAADELRERVAEILAFTALRVDGLMTIGRQVATADEARATFRGLRELAEDLRTAHPALGPELSMGMTDDYPIAVEEGATIVRVGRALFGERHDHHHG